MQTTTLNPSKFASQRAVIISLLLTIPVTVMGLLSYLTLGSHPYSLTEHRAGADMTFSVDRRWVLFSNSCVQITWKADHIRAIYLGSQGVTGEGSESVCLDKSTPAFLVRFQGYLTPDKIYALP